MWGAMPMATITPGSTKTFLNQWSTRQMRRWARQRAPEDGAGDGATSVAGGCSVMVGRGGPRSVSRRGRRVGADVTGRRYPVQAMTSGRGTNGVDRTGADAATVVAAFDFDGTLSTRDNFVPFLREFAGGSTFAREMTSAAVQVLGGGRDRWTRDELKAAALAHIMTGRRADDFEATARRFAREILRDHLRAEAVDQARWHREHGHRLVIVSASLAAYLRPVADELGFDAVLATELEVGDDGRLTGAHRRPQRARPGEGAPARRVPRRVGLR